MDASRLGHAGMRTKPAYRPHMPRSSADTHRKQLSVVTA